MFKIFVVEDEPLIRKGIIKYIEPAVYSVGGLNYFTGAAAA